MVNILIAEDDKDDFLLLEEAIENILPDYTITRSCNGKELLQRLKDNRVPDFIFLDLSMPKMNGIDCLMDIRRQKQWQTIPVIIYSTSSDFEDIDLCYKNGCTLYMVKPPSFKKLLIQLKRLFLQKLTQEVLHHFEKRFRTFVQASSNKVYTMSADWKKMYLLSGKEVFNRAPLDSQCLLKNIPGEDRLLVEKTILQAICHKKIVELEHRMIKEDDSVGWFFTRAIPILDEQGEIVEWLGMSSDITARKHAEEELRAEKHFLEQVTDHTPHLIYIFDLQEQCFTYINRRIQELTGISQEYVYGMGPHLFKKILHSDDLRSCTAYLNHLYTLKEGEIRQNEFRILVGTQYHWFRSRDRIFKKEGGKVKQVIGLGEEVTYEKTLKEKLSEEQNKTGLN